MSAWADDLDHFSRVAEQAGGTRKDFVQRKQFGQYLKQQLAEAIESNRLDK